jgi:peptidoglycan/LPS O-acetylase OafA/YrhL
MPGGFIGVDIFFVISGYLISGIIIKQEKQNKFSYTEFYIRRIKRIYPALILVLVFVLVLGTKKLLKRPL